MMKSLRLFACCSAVAAALLLVSVDAYVYPLHMDIGGRVQNAGTPRAFNINQVPDNNALLSTPEYDAYGAKISTARYSHNNGVFTRIANQDCAAYLNDMLIDGNHPINNALNAEGLQIKLAALGFRGMVALAIVNDAVGVGRRIYWTVSAFVSAPQQQAYIDVNNDMNRWQADINQAGDVWVFVDPLTDLYGANTTPEQVCLTAVTPGEQIAATPVDPTPVYQATNNAPRFNPQMVLPPGFPAQNGNVAWNANTFRTHFDGTYKPQLRAAADQAARTSGARFCFVSHPFNQFRYEQLKTRVSGNLAINTAFAHVDDQGTSHAGQKLPVCTCAGSRLATYLRHLGLFQAPGPVPVRGQANGHSEDINAFGLRQQAYAARVAANDRVVCFAEARNNDATGLNRNPNYEVGNANANKNFFDTRPTAASCATCQAQIQFIYGNRVAPACGNAFALTNAQTIGAAAWANLQPAQKSRSFVALDEQICEEVETPNQTEVAQDQHGQLLQHNQSPLRALRHRRQHSVAAAVATD